MIQMHLSNVQIQWMMLMKTFMIIIQAKKENLDYLMAWLFHDMIADIMSNKKFQAITKENVEN